jgi:hypothetical protein
MMYQEMKGEIERWKWEDKRGRVDADWNNLPAIVSNFSIVTITSAHTITAVVANGGSNIIEPIALARRLLGTITGVIERWSKNKMPVRAEQSAKDGVDAGNNLPAIVANNAIVMCTRGIEVIHTIYIIR